MQEEWVLRGLTLHQLKDIITEIYASKSKADTRSVCVCAYWACSPDSLLGAWPVNNICGHLYWQQGQYGTVVAVKAACRSVG